MIISASRRTDIPAFYTEWFFRRLAEGSVLVRNPIYPQRISRINLSREVVDGIVFWTKNPAPMMDRLDHLSAYPFYFLFTITPYDRSLEPGLPPKSEIVKTFIDVSNTIGKERVIWRYDPIVLTSEYTVAYHSAAFKRLAAALSPFTRKCIISFIDRYRKTEKNMHGSTIIPLTIDSMRLLASSLSTTARTCGLELVSCAEAIDLDEFGISRGKCIDERLIAEIGGSELDINRDAHQRPLCGCRESIDIGSYNTCPHGCCYCYANASHEKVRMNVKGHVADSPLLYGHIDPGATITDRTMRSCKRLQQELL